MQRRTILIGTVIAGGLAAGVANGSWRSGDVEFTRPALPAPAHFDLRGELSTVHVGLPVDLAAVKRSAEVMIPDQPMTITDWLANGACAKRTQWMECTSAKLDGTFTRTGPVEILADAAGANLLVPVRYDLGATGIGWTRHLTERRSGETVLSIPFSITFNATGGLDVAARNDNVMGDNEIMLLKAKLRLDRVMEQRLKPAVRAAEEQLRASLARLPIRAAIANAWSALARPFELSAGSGLWLYAMPEHYGAGGLTVVDGQIVFRTAIAARLAVSGGEHVTSVAQKRNQPVLSQAPLPPGPTRVRVATAVDLEAMRQQADAALVTGESFDSRADRFTEPVKVKVRGTRIYAAQRQIGLELEIDATTQKGATHSGKAHLVGRPVFDAKAGTVGIADVSFPAVSTKEQQGARASGLPRIGTEPFASKFAAVARLDIMQPMKDALPRAAHLLNQKLDKDLTLSAQLTEAVPVSLELARDGAYLLADLIGELTFVYHGAPQPVVAGPAAEAPMTAVSATRTTAAIAAAAAATAVAAGTSAKNTAKASRQPGSLQKSARTGTSQGAVAMVPTQKSAVMKQSDAGRQRPFGSMTVFPPNPL